MEVGVVAGGSKKLEAMSGCCGDGIVGQLREHVLDIERESAAGVWRVAQRDVGRREAGF